MVKQGNDAYKYSRATKPTDAESVPEAGKNAITGDLDKVNPAVREAVLARIDRLPKEEQARVMDNLEKFKGTAWAAAAVKGMAYREMLDRAMAGQDISMLEKNEIWGKQDMAATKIIKAFKKYPQFGDKILRMMLDSYEFIQLARDVYFTNDERARIKKNLNEVTNSKLVEEKSYQKYN